MPKIPGAFESGMMGCFSCFSPVKLTSASSTDNSWHHLVTPEIQMCSVPLCPDGIGVHCAPISSKALEICGSDVPGHQIHTIQCTRSSLSSSWPKAGTLYSFPCENTHWVILAVADQKSSHQGQGKWFQFFCDWNITDDLLVSQQQLHWQPFWVALS